MSLQLLELLHQQGKVLQQVPVLQQQLVDPGFGFHPGSGLCCHLILQQLHLQQGEEGRT